MPPQPQKIDLTTLEPRHLVALKEQIEEELQNFAQSSITLQKAAGEFGTSGRSLESLSEQKEGQPMLMPLTSSVYVAAEVASVKTVLLDVGTGYYIEKSPKEGVEYCRRKVQMLKDSLDKIGQIMRDKQQQLQIINTEYNARARAQQQRA
ncbi:hypothetical protein WJX72_009328 [[Myrmecia] bisecta]|uniref:Prefoldin subunit 5 n=1 Tax=[Myrmecia] bisecta TaxID=41462 RepID=A0AAW1PA24_9CHLO